MYLPLFFENISLIPLKRGIFLFFSFTIGSRTYVQRLEGRRAKDVAEKKAPGNRDKAGRFVKGQSGNPNGRPKKPFELEEYARNAPAKLRAIADDPDTPVKIRADIEKFFYEAIYGKAPQALDINGEMSVKPVVFEGESEIPE